MSPAEVMTQMGINGFGRIGRLVFRAAMENQSASCRQSVFDWLAFENQCGQD